MDAPHGVDPKKAQLDDDNPWPGLESYDERSQAFFAGRSGECDELFRRIADEPMTVLFGKSGLGKTSLLKAGVFPRLRERGFLPVPVRVLVRGDAGPFIAQVARALFDALEQQHVDYPEPRPEQSLWEYLHVQGLELWTKQNRLVRPVFVFDQFEELFTLGKAVPDLVATFAEDLADLAENRIPAGIVARIEDCTLNEHELDLQAMPYKLVITLREDFLPDLEGLRLTMPSLRRNRMRLLPMGREQALEAVRNPHTERLVPEAIAASIVEFLGSGSGADAPGAGEANANATLTVEPALLSLFCRGVNEHRKEAGKAAFDEALLEGGKESIVADFYRTTVRDQPERVCRFIEEELITEQGFRNSYSVEDALDRGALTAEALATLVDRRLLRLDHYLGVERVELTHDILTKAVREERARRRELERARRARRKLARWGGLVALGVVGLVTAGSLWANELSEQRLKAHVDRAKAEKERQIARSQSYAARAELTLDSDPGLALLLAQKGLALADTAEARAAVLHVAEYAWPELALSEGELGGVPVTLAMSLDGVRVAVIGARELTMWDVSAAAPRKLWATDRKQANVLTFSPQGKTLAVGNSEGIALYSAATGERVRADLRLPGESNVLAYSPGGDWLAAAGPPDGSDTTGTQRGGLLLWNLKAADPKPEWIAFDGVGLLEIAVVDDEARVLLAISEGLTAYRVDRAGRHRLEKLSDTSCLSPRSISLGGSRVSATFKATPCVYDAPLDAAGQFERGLDLPLYDKAVDDVVWSASGKAFLATVPPVGMVLGTRDDKRTIRMRGVRPRSFANSRNCLAPDEGATRLAVIDDQESVRVYTLERSLPYMTRLTYDGMSIAPDGRWMAAWTSVAGRSKLEWIPLEGGKGPSTPRWSLDVPLGTVSAVATQNFLVYDVRGPSGIETRVADVTTRQERTVPSRVDALGSERELLLAGTDRDPWIERVRDGSKVAWKSCELGTTVVVLSRHRGAFATLCDQATGGPLRTVTNYAVRGEVVEELGKVSDLPRYSGVEILDGGRSIVETRYSAQGAPLTLVWQVNANKPTSAQDQVELKAAERLAAQRVARQKGTLNDLSLVDRMRLGNLVTLFPRGEQSRHAFSIDEGRLAVWGGNLLQVFDLTRDDSRIVTLRFEDGEIEEAEFEAGNKLVSVRFQSMERLLVPLDTTLIQGFAARLVGSRTLTPDERCANTDAICIRRHAPPPASTSSASAVLDVEP
jgi:hypothetical protein